MLAGMAMTVVTCVLLFILPDDYLLFGTAGMVIVCIAVDVVFYMRLDSFAQKRFHQLWE